MAFGFAWLWLHFFISWPVQAQFAVHIDLEAAPFDYEQTQDDNRVTRLLKDIKSGNVQLVSTPDHGYLESLLAALQIPISSQGLVFSKTSLQVQHITRWNPRAIYFNDDTYVGWVRGSDLMEISTVDPKLGAAFYAVEMTPWKAQIKRANFDCLGCHATSMTQGIPGHTVRSVFPAVDGTVDARRESFVTTDTSPFRERWGGWYVTGTHGSMRHMGNTFLQGGIFDTSAKSNLQSLSTEFDVSEYLSPHSDIVALMVLEHQTQLHNAFTKADFSVRQLLFDRQNQPPSVDEQRKWELDIKNIAQEVVEQLLFCTEFPLSSNITGTSSFSRDFQNLGPHDRQHRSLRDFDLETRLFKFPCSYLIYSQAFQSLQPPLRAEILNQLFAVLSEESPEPAVAHSKFGHLTTQMRRDILAILTDTLPDLPNDWQSGK
ncbi:MAG: hypothetical protein KDB03_15170 [Planctomycetales bacterium]|nr:hypothetical protein [Planctomycetales bacterium]